nr:hypothetical protein Iba_chr09bCG1500 [Ipomoea batatas]
MVGTNMEESDSTYSCPKLVRLDGGELVECLPIECSIKSSVKRDHNAAYLIFLFRLKNVRFKPDGTTHFWQESGTNAVHELVKTAFLATGMDREDRSFMVA